MAKSAKKIKPPKGTRDLYPEDVLRQRYITNAWRDASIRCGFDEIAGPTFESTDLYAVKSGDGILGELFQAFSGKSDREIEKVKSTGQAEYALRPEFTPTLARMYAAKSKELPKPCKWFTAGPYFRAERPQRGRLREFLQWNVDCIADNGTQESQILADTECMFALVNSFELLGMNSTHVKLHIGSRGLVRGWALKAGFKESQLDNFYVWLDGRNKRTDAQNDAYLDELGLNKVMLVNFNNTADEAIKSIKSGAGLASQFDLDMESVQDLIQLVHTCRTVGLHDFASTQNEPDQWCSHFDSSIVRGLAYYTGTVFEALADGERAVAGGGRYDNLIELFGGPPTPACGFGMGDVVLSNLLDDKELMPEGLELMEAVARPQASIRPEAFIVPNGDEDYESLVHTLTANLRRGIESEQWSSREDRKPWNADRYAVAPLHARISYKSTRKTNKLRDDAMKQHAKFFIVINADDNAELHNLDTHETVGTFSTNPTADNYIGQAIQNAIAGHP